MASDNALGTLASIEHALGSLDDRLKEREADLTLYHCQSEDLAKQLNQPFEHEETLSAATKRQQEIVGHWTSQRTKLPQGWTRVRSRTPRLCRKSPTHRARSAMALSAQSVRSSHPPRLAKTSALLAELPHVAAGSCSQARRLCCRPPLMMSPLRCVLRPHRLRADARPGRAKICGGFFELPN